VDEFASVQEHHALFGQVLSLFAQRTLLMLSTLDDLTNHPALCEDFYNLLSRCITDVPNVAFASGLLPHCLSIAISGIRLQHREAARAIFVFIRTCFDAGSSKLQFRS
jgi:transportin-3